jgi:hypothetical protein
MTTAVACVALAAACPAAGLASSSVNWGTGLAAVAPANATANSTVDLNAVSCASPGNCGAVGIYVAGGVDQGLLLTQTAGSWGAGREAVLPTGASTTNPSIVIPAVSCPAVGSCVAVGTYLDSSSHYQGLLLTETGGVWADGVKAPLPVATATNPAVTLSSVACPSAGNCAAVGSFFDNLNHKQGLLLNESGGSWSAAAMLLPSGAPASAIPDLNAVSCASPGNCTAVGDYDDTSGHEQGLMVTESSGTWGQALEASLPADAFSSPGARLTAVSCASAGNCGAIGSYANDAAGDRAGLLLTQSAGTWATGVEAPVRGQGTAPLTGISCPSPGNCVAVGTSDATGGFVVSQTSGTWGSAVTAPVPPGGQDSSESAVSYVSVGNCVTVGNYSVNGLGSPAFSVTESSGQWGPGVALALPTDASSPPGSTLSSLSCAAIANCSAVGNYNRASGGSPGLLLTAAPASPSLAAAGPATAITGQAIAPSDIAAVLSSGAQPTGTVSFVVVGPQSTPPSGCGGGTALGATTVAGNGTYHPPSGFTPSSAGDYRWYASYGGDLGDDQTASTCGASMAETVVSDVPPPTATTSPATAPTAATPAGNPPPGPGAVAVERVRVARSTVLVLLRCDGQTGSSCSVTLTLSRMRATLAAAAVSLVAGQIRTIVLRLNRAGHQLLRTLDRFRAKLTAVQDGRAVASRKLSFHSPAKHRRRSR